MSDENKIYIGGLALETTSESLRAHFSKFGEITDCIVMTDKVSGRSRGFGFASFKEIGSMNAALGTSNAIDGREVSCKKAVRENPQMYVQGSDGIYNSVKIFVGGLPATCDYEKFTSYFSRFGQIEDAVVMMDIQTQRHRGFGYVTFSENSAVEAALNNYAANQIDGKWIEVKRCIPQDKMSPGMSLKGKGKGAKGVNGKAMTFAPAPATAYGALHYGLPQIAGTSFPMPIYGSTVGGSAYPTTVGGVLPYGAVPGSEAFGVVGSAYGVAARSHAYVQPRYGTHSAPY